MTGADPALAAWHDAVAACVVGAERARSPALPPALNGLATGGGPGGLLATVAALGAWRTAGRVLDAAGIAPLGLMEQDILPECGEAAAARLERLLSGTAAMSGLFGEWCRLAAAAGVRAPAGLAPALLKLSRDMEWEGDADQVLGARRHWLRGLDDLMPTPAAGLEDWTGLNLLRRVEALRLMRGQDPVAAREALAAVWRGEAAEARAKLLAALRVGLGEMDEPFLEERLDDRSGPVRMEASFLLKHLPGSRLAARMQERAQAAVRFAADGTLEVALPEADKAGVRDGLLVDRGWSEQGEYRLRWVIGAAPLMCWDGHPPAAWLSAAMAGEWGPPLVAGWADAAFQARDAPWLTALVGALTPVMASRGPNAFYHDAWSAAFTGMPAAEKERIAAFYLDVPDLNPASALLMRCGHDWSPALTAAALAWVGRLFGPGGPFSGEGWNGGGLHLSSIALHCDPDAAARPLAALLAALPEHLGPALRREVDMLSDTIRLRAGMKQEFAA